MNTAKTVCALLVVAPTAALCETPAPADTLEEIVVTATKRTQRLLDVPVAISAISTQDIQERGITQYADYLNSVPGVYFEDAGPGVGQIRMRGVVADEGGGSSTVATYFGDTITSIYTAGGGKPNLRFVDIDRVEVLRGPQGTLFGANALSGVVRVVSAAPNLNELAVKLDTRGYTTAHSDDGSYHVEGVLNVPLLQDRVALRLVAYRDDIAGYIDNVVTARPAIDYSDALGVPPGTLVVPAVAAFTHKDINRERTWGARAALSWQATEDLRFDLTSANQSVVLDSEPQVQPAIGPYDQQRALDQYAPGGASEDLAIGTFGINYDWSAVSLVSATSFTRMHRTALTDASHVFEESLGVPIPSAIHDDSLGRLFTQEVRLQSREGSALQWLVGLFYLKQETDQKQSVGDYSCPTCIPALYGQDFAFENSPGSDPRYLNLTQKAIFGDLNYQFTPQWTVGAGARYQKEDIEGLTPATAGYLADSSSGFAPAEPPRRGSSNVVNPSAYVRFKPQADTTLYLQAARGFRSARANEQLSYTGTCAAEAAAVGLGPLVDPDTLWSYELGSKSRIFNGRLHVNAAVYHQDWHGVQVPTSLQCGFSGTINGGDASGNGVELEIDAQVTDSLRLNLSAAYGKNEFDTVRPATGYAKGEQVPGSPQDNASAGLEYDFKLSTSWRAFARGDFQFVDNVHYQYGQGASAAVLIQPSHTQTNLRLGFEHDQLGIDLFARNVTDERAVVFTGDPQLGGYQYLLRPRELGVELRYSFQ